MFWKQTKFLQKYRLLKAFLNFMELITGGLLLFSVLCYTLMQNITSSDI